MPIHGIESIETCVQAFCFLFKINGYLSFHLSPNEMNFIHFNMWCLKILKQKQPYFGIHMNFKNGSTIAYYREIGTFKLNYSHHTTETLILLLK